MDEPKSLETEIPSAVFIEVKCGQCCCETRHKVMAETRSQYSLADGEVDVWLKHRILQCQGCLTESFCREYQCSEDYDYDPDTDEPVLSIERTLYPNPSAGNSEISNIHYLPNEVAAIYREALSGLEAKLPVSAGFAMRAIIESVCIDNEIKGNNLEIRIERLCSAGLITPAARDILHSLRFMGNDAVHRMKAHSIQEIANALDIVGILLQNVYVLPKLAKALPASAKKRAGQRKKE